jgi:Ser/Thr protein kinase RdoA (MazF antagonist)
MLDAGHADAIARAFTLGDDATMIGPVARGELGQVWRLTTSSGSWAVKEPFERKLDVEIREEADVQDRALAAGIPTPAVERTRDGDPSLAIGGVHATVSSWVEMRDRDPYLDPADVGSLVASLHRLTLPDVRPEDPWYREPVPGDRWDELIRELTAEGAPFVDGLASCRDELVALGELVGPPSRLQTCHRDLWADNVRATADGGICVFDWENFGLADESQELCLVLFEFGVGDPVRIGAIYDAYLDAGGPGRVEGRATFSMLIAQLGHIGEAGCRQWLEGAASSPEREHAEGWVGEFLGQPLSRSAIDGILDALH